MVEKNKLVDIPAYTTLREATVLQSDSDFAYYATPEGAGYQQIVAGVMENQLTVDELKFLRGCWKTESVRRYGLIREDAHLLKKLNKMIDSLLTSAPEAGKSIKGE